MKTKAINILLLFLIMPLAYCRVAGDGLGDLIHFVSVLRSPLDCCVWNVCYHYINMYKYDD